MSHRGCNRDCSQMNWTTDRKKALLIATGALLCILLFLLISNLRSVRLFPDLDEDVSLIRISDALGKLEMKRSGDDAWVIPAFGDAPVDPVKITDLIAALQKARRGEDKTADPALYDEVGLGKAAVLLQLQNSEGALLVDLRLGNASSTDANARFALLPNDPQSFLIEGLGAVSANGLHWTNAKPPKLESARLSQITLIEPSLQRMELERGGSGRWSRTDIASTNEARATLLAETLSSLEAEALRSAESINWFNAHILLADTQDGLQLSFQAKREKNIVWLRINAAARQDASSAVQSEAAQMNALRHMAFAISGDAADALTSTAAQFILK